MKPPILLCGCPGSGTSLVAKMLRQAGLFTGVDSGPAEARKYHESQCFKQYNIELLTKTIDFPHAPKSAEQFNNHNAIMQGQLGQLAGLVDREKLLAQYWGENTSRRSTTPWGWKDPRNSATAMIWKEIFPELRVIVVGRDWQWRDRWKSGGSDSGKWYRKQSTAELRELYQNPIGLAQNSVHRVDIDQLTGDAEFFGQVLTWCELDSAPMSDFADFLTQVGYEKYSSDK